MEWERLFSRFADLRCLWTVYIIIWRLYVRLVTVVTNENLHPVGSLGCKEYRGFNQGLESVPCMILPYVTTLTPCCIYYAIYILSTSKFNIIFVLLSQCAKSLETHHFTSSKIVPRRVNITHTYQSTRAYLLPQILDVNTPWIGSRYYNVRSLNSRHTWYATCFVQAGRE